MSRFAGLPVPKIPNIHRLVYEAATASPGALEMRDWHTCETTHCRAGWIVVCAGKEGVALERRHGTALAAELICEAAGAPINPNRFFDSNEDALADMKRMAEESP